MTGVRYLTREDVLAIHRAEVGEPTVDFRAPRVRGARPQASVAREDAYPDIRSKAAALFHSLIRNHLFVDGNKRTAVLALVVFCGLNGYRVDAVDDDVVELAVETASGQLDIDAIRERIARWCRPVADP